MPAFLLDDAKDTLRRTIPRLSSRDTCHGDRLATLEDRCVLILQRYDDLHRAFKRLIRFPNRLAFFARPPGGASFAVFRWTADRASTGGSLPIASRKLAILELFELAPVEIVCFGRVQSGGGEYRRAGRAQQPPQPAPNVMISFTITL